MPLKGNKMIPHYTCNKEFGIEDLDLICPNCERIMPNQKHRRRHGCKYCVPGKPTKYSNGKY